mmetsp:Transcript_13558/g.35548  ORF Transcript_13558/g.35548 Transcript_13558/m.35548 type:complete len:160 (+) Transcript_13558:86-565(+)
MTESTVITESNRRRHCVMSSGSKRTAAVMLGTNWRSVPAATPARRPCNACDREAGKRYAKTKEQRMEMLDSGKQAHMCAERCGGVKMVGDGTVTNCPVHGPIYMCYSCFRPITWSWVLKEAQRKELLDGGASLRELIKTNKMLLDLEAEAAAGETGVLA